MLDAFVRQNSINPLNLFNIGKLSEYIFTIL